MSGVRSPVERLSLDRVAGCIEEDQRRNGGNWGWWEHFMCADLYKARVDQAVEFWQLGEELATADSIVAQVS